MAYKMKGSTFFGKSPLKQKPLKKSKTYSVAGEETGIVKKTKKGEDYAIYGEGAYWGEHPNIAFGDTIVSPPKHIIKSGGDKYIQGGDYKVKKTGPKKYKITK